MPQFLHAQFMQRCIQLAKLGLGNVAPNPMVGAVIELNGKIIGEGYHHQFGAAHAEVNAINSTDEALLKDGTLYVNLEPCSHFGKTPPCADLIIEKGIKRVVIGCLDPFKEVAGRGIATLKAHGVDVILDVCKEQCLELNKRFITSLEKKRPYIILKYAQTADGYIGLDATHDISTSRQISRRESQQLTHRWRSEESAILVGTNTALLDNPKLNTRFFGGNNPTRILLDKDLKVPFSNNIYDTTQNTIVFTQKNKSTRILNCTFLEIDFNAPAFLKEMLEIVLENNLQSIIIEGGAATLQSFYDANLWDESRIFTSTTSWGKGIKSPLQAKDAKIISEEKIATDTLTIYKNTTAS